jgi:hypothetical protein
MIHLIDNNSITAKGFVDLFHSQFVDDTTSIDVSSLLFLTLNEISIKLKIHHDLYGDIISSNKIRFFVNMLLGDVPKVNSRIEFKNYYCSRLLKCLL